MRMIHFVHCNGLVDRAESLCTSHGHGTQSVCPMIPGKRVTVGRWSSR